MMQTDVKSTRLTGAGTIFAGPTRVKGFICAGAASTAATFEFRDASATGSIFFQHGIPSNANINTFSITFPGEGIWFQNGAYLTLSVGSVTSITVFYG